MYQKFQFFSDEEPSLKDADTNLQDEGDEDEGEGGSEGSEEPFFHIDPNKVRVEKVRLDKWLWAARFFKTRPLARIEVEAGNVLYNGEQTKPSREIELNAVLKIRQRRCERTVIIRGLSTRRRSKDDALLLFEETPESKQARDRQQENWQSKSDFQGASQFSFSPQGSSDQERRPVRFLRRSFGRNAQQPAQQQPPSYSQPLYPTPPHHQHRPHQPQYPSAYQQNNRHQTPHQTSHYQPPQYPAHTRNPYPAPPSQRYPASPYPGSSYPRTPQPPRHQAPQKPRNPQYVDQEFVEPLE